MKWTQLVILNEAEDGTAIGFRDHTGTVDPAGVILASKTGPNANTDAIRSAQFIVHSVNSFNTLVKALNDSLLCLEEAASMSPDKARYRTKYWAAAASEARFALENAKKAQAWYSED